MKWKSKADLRDRRHFRLRKKIQGTAVRPRMSVFVSNKHMYVQFVDDLAARTLASASTLLEGTSSKSSAGTESARKLGALAAEAAKKQGIEQVVFDRGGFAYRGRVKLLAEAAREAGLKF